jgi:pyruvate/2-oxoglutarate dehydrogenase complex dihydrolipoamide acyltransferase (E2) component
MLAARLTQIKQTVPHFYLQTDCDVDRMLGALTRINAQHPGGKLTITGLHHPRVGARAARGSARQLDVGRQCRARP